ncbi:MAG: SGNH/GDSL hydrolase family protein [Lachnospiraceae bacterium]|nr:SGNH/GDSL hydrolase family protein [Lachnospiraceae bacterium]
MFRSKKMRACVRCAAFLCIFFVIAGAAGGVLGEKNAEMLSARYFEEPAGTHDIVFLGPSTIMNGVYPLLLWDRFGYTAYNLGAGNETAEASYYLAKRAIKQDHPKLIVMDCGLLRKEKVIDSVNFLHFVTDRMPALCAERWELLARSALEGRPSLGALAGLCFPILEYHSRWDGITAEDFEESEKTVTYGAKVDARSMTAEPELFAPVKADADASLPEHSERTLRELIALCRETDTGLVLVTMPTLAATKYIGQGTYEERAESAAAVKKIADELGVPYINMFDDGSAFGLSLEDDTVEGFHLNVTGAEKFTQYMGTYISETFDIDDRRDDPKYRHFDEAYAAFRDYVLEKTGRDLTQRAKGGSAA